MKTMPTSLAGVLIIEPQIWHDERGFFFESFHQQKFNVLAGTNYHFVQDNYSRSAKGVLRGLHYQIQQPQGKLVRVLRGSIFDVAVDIRPQSPQFGQWFGTMLSADEHRMLWIPPGFAHGFLTMSDHADVLYKTTDYYAPQHERCLAWNDTDLGIKWPLAEYGINSPLLSEKDMKGHTLSALYAHFEGERNMC